MVSRKLLGPGLIALFLMALGVLAPARLVVSMLPENTLAMQGVTGSLWRGEASVAVLDTGNGYLHLGELKWRLKPLSLLSFAPQLELASHWGAQRIAGSLRFKGRDHIELENIDALLDAQLLRHYAPLELSGSVSLQISHLEVQDGLSREGAGRVVWQNGGWISTRGQRSLGSYAIDFSQQRNEPLQGAILTLQGGLQAAGDLALRDRSYAIDVFLHGPAIGDPQLRQALQLVASPQGDGFRVKFSGDL